MENLLRSTFVTLLNSTAATLDAFAQAAAGATNAIDHHEQLLSLATRAVELANDMRDVAQLFTP